MTQIDTDRYFDGGRDQDDAQPIDECECGAPVYDEGLGFPEHCCDHCQTPLCEDCHRRRDGLCEGCFETEGKES